MDLYAADEPLATLEADAARAPEPAALAELAWHLRERDCARSLELVSRLQALPEARIGRWRRRLCVARAQALLLQFRIDEAVAELARIPIGIVQAEDERILTGDAALVEAAIATAQGRPHDEVAAARKAREAFEAAGDAKRAAIAISVELVSTGKANPRAAREEIARLKSQSADAVLRAHLDYVDAVLEFIAGDFARAIELITPGAEGAHRLGAVEVALRSLLTLAAALSNLGDRDESARLGEEALARARALGWPRWIAGSLAHLGRLFTYMEQSARAIEVLEEAVALFAPQPKSRHHAMVLFYLGDAYLHAGDPARALERLSESEAIARELGLPPEIAANKSIAARALGRLGRTEEALGKARSAIDLARSCGAKLWEAEALRSLAEIELASAPGEALAHLDAALRVSEVLGGHHEKSQLWVEIARVHERSGDLAAALAAERKARAEQLDEQNRRAANQVMVSRMRHEMEALALREAEMRRLATTDALTGLANRRHFFQVAEKEIARSQRSGEWVGLVMGDIDRFKSINDGFGHPAGDAALCAVAGTLATESRPHDLVGRLGGEEFAVLLPGADIEAVLAAAERLRSSVESLAVSYEGACIPVTISLGCVAAMPPPPDAGAEVEASPERIFESMVRDADAALYEAKRGGRNRCVASTHAPTEAGR